MAESTASDWVLGGMEGLHQWAGSMRFQEEEQEQIDLGRVV